MRYIPLNIKTEYDLMNSLIRIKDLISFALKKEIYALGITDPNMFGTMEFINECNKNNIKPIIGTEVIVNDMYMLMYAKNYNGLTNLFKIVSHKNIEGTLDIDYVKDNSSDLIIVTNAPGTAVIFVIIMISASPTYSTAINGTTTSDTLEILWIPPITTSPTQSVRISPAITVAQEYSPLNSATVCAIFGSKKFLTAEAILFTCVNVPIPNKPTPAPKNANSFASHFQFFPIPFSI